jgi:uncharacterized protein YndB with AHSA1/START domain
MQDSVTRSISIAASPDRVWTALTAEFGTWFRVDLGTPFVPGQIVEGSMTMPGAEGLPFKAECTAMDPPRRFAFRWPQWDFEAKRNLDGIAPWTEVAFTLEPEGAGTKVTVTESGFAALGEPLAARILGENTEGWEIQLRNLRDHLA